MHARPGDWLVVDRSGCGLPPRRALVLEVHSPDGAPPYHVRWLDTEHEGVVFPGEDAHVEHAPSAERPASGK
ncbi:hypothetical protein GCM10010174_52100 [Kutzneria viridogrisea]|uniref:DUF1918 domain-containing protein n=2 Tax=Kutzneria TaxID=43356 RepID=W5W8C3_9PSEU|nr:DUF1918 domain-containing protein [Kutzneria albida]AHH97005.1 hypothetical protein KALB_3641 [Kutzneria albida DSM 43870]MBA8932029.1 hypothetical protein [Kutzneria viridogrisea]